jgi:hypothetical protein
VAVFTDRWRLGSIAGDLPEGSLSSLLTL